MQDKQETQVWSLDQEDPLEKQMETHSSVLVLETLWTEELGRDHKGLDTTELLSTPVWTQYKDNKINSFSFCFHIENNIMEGIQWALILLRYKLVRSVYKRMVHTGVYMFICKTEVLWDSGLKIENIYRQL